MLYIVVTNLLFLIFGVMIYMTLKTKRGSYLIGAACTIGIVCVWALMNSIVVIDNDRIGIVKKFGVTKEGYLPPGLSFVNPITSIVEYNRLRQGFRIATDGDDALVAITADQNPLTMDVGFAIKISPKTAWLVQSKVGDDYMNTVIHEQARTAIRDGVARFPWTSTAGDKREQTAAAIQSIFAARIVSQLEKSGIPKEDAQLAFTVYPVSLLRVLPDKKVLNSIAEKTASEQDLQRQSTLTSIAAQEALRRGNEGEGVSNLFKNLPNNFTATEIATVLQALATKQRADAMLKAVESGSVQTLIINGDTGTPPTLSVK